MTVREYSSSDASAPQGGATAGALLAVLRACLVTGYGDKAAAGWSEAYTGTNTAVFRQPVGSSNGMYLRVDDTDTAYARVRWYETMSGVNTGTGLCPTDAQLSGGYYSPKWTGAYSWHLVTNGKFVCLWVQVDTTPNFDGSSVTLFGDISSFKAGDNFGTVIFGSPYTTYTSSHGHSLSNNFSWTPAGYISRKYTQIGGSQPVYKMTDGTMSNQATFMGQSGLPYPNGPDGGLYLSPVAVMEAETSAIAQLRGIIQGVWNPCHIRPLGHLDTFSGTGNLAGKTFRALNVYQGQMFVEISDTW